ncbi:sulfotransferase family protein [Lacinutrix jangbogonensis]|uniref:sulfotransferase family protein n=1 Tax=Lacinutrix jangbogonensis TaxID=1469557 RepID=UPI00068DAFE4|nr:sulfotransferase [Lacinutrix jangbogonensis]
MNLFKILKNNNKDKVGLFILGAQKCGTTSLHYYLSQHPLFLGSQPKETDFFSYDRYYEKGVDFYHKFFDLNLKQKRLLKFDSSTEYLYIPYCAERIKKYNPNSKFIIIKRDPVKRAISAYKMYKALSQGELWSEAYFNRIKMHSSEFESKMLKLLVRKPFPEFADLIREEVSLTSTSNNEFIYEPSLIARGNYEHQKKRFLHYFPKENIFEIDFERYAENTIEVLNEVLGFLDIKQDFFDESYDLSIQLKSRESFFLDTDEYISFRHLFNENYRNNENDS